MTRDGGAPQPQRDNRPIEDEEKDQEDERNLLSYFRGERDASENQETAPPPEEVIEYLSVTVAECYPPSHVADLVSGLTTLGWGDSDRESLGDPQPIVEWVQSRAQTHHGGAWINLGLIVKEEDRKCWMPSPRTASLPNSVDYAFGSIFHLLPSSFVVVIQFVLSPDARQRVQQALTTIYETTATTVLKGWRIHRPSDQKRASIIDIREQLRGECVSWFSKYLPGAFATSGKTKLFPTCEFFTCEVGHPYDPASRGSGQSYMSILDLDKDHRAWQCKPLGLKLAQVELQDLNHAWVLAGKKSEILETKRLDGYGGRSIHGLTSRLAYELEFITSRLALESLLCLYENDLADLHNEGIMALADTSSYSSATILQSIEMRLMRISGEVVPIASELAAFSREHSYFLHDLPEFIPISDVFTGEISLFDLFRKALLQRSEQVHHSERAAREFVTTAGSILNARAQESLAKSNLRLQRLAFALALIVGIATIVQICIGLIQIWISIPQ